MEYDDVLNKHRTVIYKRRRDILSRAKEATNEGERPLKQMVIEAVDREIEQIVSYHTAAEEIASWEIGDIQKNLHAMFPQEIGIETRINELSVGLEKQNDAIKARSMLIERSVALAREAYEKIEQDVGDNGLMGEIEKALLLRATDDLWIEHLDAIDHLRRAVSLQGYGQRDPLVEYKREAYRLFHELLALIDKQVAHGIFKVKIARQIAEQELGRIGSRGNLQFQGPAKTMDAGGAQHATRSAQRDPRFKDVGRNDPCPCGAKKEDGTSIKFKHCHGRNV